MTKLKRILAGSLALCMAGSMLTACGGDDILRQQTTPARQAEILLPPLTTLTSLRLTAS